MRRLPLWVVAARGLGVPRLLLLPLCLLCLPLQPLGPLPPMQLLPMPLRPMQLPPMPPLPMLCHSFCLLMDGALAEQGEASGGRVIGVAHSIFGAREMERGGMMRREKGRCGEAGGEGAMQWSPMPPLPMLLPPPLPPLMITLIICRRLRHLRMAAEWEWRWRWR